MSKSMSNNSGYVTSKKERKHCSAHSRLIRVLRNAMAHAKRLKTPYVLRTAMSCVLSSVGLPKLRKLFADGRTTASLPRTREAHMSHPPKSALKTFCARICLPCQFLFGTKACSMAHNSQSTDPSSLIHAFHFRGMQRPSTR